MPYWVGSIFWVIIGLGVAIHAQQLGLGRLRQPGPGFIFFVAGVFLFILALVDLATTFLKGLRTENKEGKSVKLGPRWRKVLFVLVVLSVYVYFFSDLGFLLSTFLLIVFLFKGVEPTGWWMAIVGSIITILVSWGIFEIWLKVPFPRGLLDF